MLIVTEQINQEVYRKYIEKIFTENHLHKARMISASKSGYRNRYPYNKVIFNAKVYDSLEKIANPIWHGDLDINYDGTNLKNIAQTIGKTLYVVYESGFNIPSEIVWDTTQIIPVVTKEYIALKIKEEEEYLRDSRIATIKKYRSQILENKQYEKVDFIKIGAYRKKINFPQKLLEEEFAEFYKIASQFKRRPKRSSPRFKKYFLEFGYFTSYFLEIYLKNKLNIQDGYMINPSSIWISRGLNKKLRAIDFAIEKVFDPNFNYTQFGRFVTCNYCVDYLYSLNEQQISQKSYEDEYLYIRDGYEKERFWIN